MKLKVFPHLLLKFFIWIFFFLSLSIQDTSLATVQQVPVELQVTNLDQNIDAREMKRILFTIFRDHVMVSGLEEFDFSHI